MTITQALSMKQATVRRSLIAMISVVLPLSAPAAMAAFSDAPVQAQAVPGEPVDLGALYVNGLMTLDASTPIFHFTTFELTAGSTLSFSNLTATDFLQLSASQSIRIFGELQAAPAGSLSIQAPQVVIGQDGLISLSGGSVTLSAGRVVDVLHPAGEPFSGGTVIVSAGGSLDVVGAQRDPLAEPIRVGEGGSLQIRNGGSLVTLQAPVPEPESWTMLLAGLGLVGWAVARRNRSGER